MQKEWKGTSQMSPLMKYPELGFGQDVMNMLSGESEKEFCTKGEAKSQE